MKIDIWKRPWMAALVLLICFLLVGYFEREDRELLSNITPLSVEAMR